MPNCPLTLRTVKGSKLTFNELDSNFVSLQNCINVVENNLNNLVNNTLNNRWHVPSGTTVTINDGFQGFVYGDLYVEGLIDLVGDSQLVVLNGDIILSGGTISGTGVTYLIDLPEYNTFLTGGTYNTSTQALDLSGNYGFNAFSIDLSYLSNDITVTGGTYNSSTGTVTFYNNSGGTFDVSGFLTGYTNYYTTGATLNGTNLEFDRTDLSNAYSVDLSPLKFTGNTISECIPELYVSNIYSCSPLYINPNDEGDVRIGSVSLFIDSSTYHVGVGISPPQARLHVNNTSPSNSLLVEDSTNPDATPFVVDNMGSVGVGTPNPSEKLEVSGKTKTISLQITSGATNGYVLTSDALGNAVWKATSGGVTGFTYSNNNFTISQAGAPSLTANISVMTGLTVNGLTLISGNTPSMLTVVGSGSTTPIFSVLGSQGELFSITDSLIGSLFSVNDISGLPVIEAFSDNTILMGSYQAPSLNTTVKSTLTAGTNTIYSIPVSAYTGYFVDYTLMGTSGARAGNIMSIWSGTSAQYSETSTNDIGLTTDVTFSVSVSGDYAILSSSATTTGWTLKTIIRSI